MILNKAQARALEKKRKGQSKTQDLSNALRREVVAYMTSGIAVACKQTAQETYAAMTVEDDDPFGMFIFAFSLFVCN